MKLKVLKTSAYLLSVLLFWSAQAAAGVITCGSTEREASLDPATACEVGGGNPENPNLQSYWARPDAWQDVGHIDTDIDAVGGTYTDGFLSIVFESGGFDSNSVDLFWTIADEFWNEFTEAVITIHVGNGNGDPDHFAWLIEPNATSGSLAYDRLLNGGGGFSNIVLWGNGAVSVPEPGTLALLGTGLLLLGLRRRSRSITTRK